jgi:hypothetical protein
MAGPELGTAFAFRRYIGQGADGPLAAWSLLVGGVASAAAGGLLVAGGALSSGTTARARRVCQLAGLGPSRPRQRPALAHLQILDSSDPDKCM